MSYSKLIYVSIIIEILTSCVSDTSQPRKNIITKENILPYEVACGDNGEMLYVKWQPAIRRMVFPVRRENPFELYLYSCDDEGKNGKKLVSTNEPDFLECALSPDGKKLLYVASGITRGYSYDITLLDLDTNKEVMLTPCGKVDIQGKEVPIETEGEIYYTVDSYAGSWSPKGHYIIHRIYLIDDRKPSKREEF